MTLFNFEVPTKHLELFDKYQDYHFALSFLCRENKQYFNYIKRKVEAGERVILDNSYNELGEPDDPNELVKLYWELSGRWELEGVVSPDSDRWRFGKLKDAFDCMTYHLPKEKIWVVVRTEEEFNFFEDQVRCSTFMHRPDQPLLRECPHYLGLVDPIEIIYYRPISCDTSMPIKLALKGMTCQEWVYAGCPHYHTRMWPDFFDLKLTSEQIKLAVENILWIKRIANVKFAP